MENKLKKRIYCPSKSEALAKDGGLPFTPTAQTAKNVNLVVHCQAREKWRLINAKHTPKKVNSRTFWSRSRTPVAAAARYWR